MSVSGFFKSSSTGFLMMAVACTTSPQVQTGASEASTPQLAPTTPAFVQKDILGKSAETLDTLLGEAALIRREGNGEFRRYTLASCSLIVILYPDNGALPQATHLDAAAKTSEEEKPDLDTCLAAGLTTVSS